MKEEMTARIEGAKRTLGPLKIEILSVIFESQKSVSEGVGAKRFRADHKNWISDLEDMASKHTLVRRTNDVNDVYHVAPYALPLLESNKASRIIEAMEAVLSRLQNFYDERLDETLAVEELLGIDGIEDEDVRHALYFLGEAHGIFSSRSTNFPYADESSCHLYEGVIRVESSLDILCQYYDKLDGPKPAMMPQGLLYSDFSYAQMDSPSIVNACLQGDERLLHINFLDKDEKRVMQEIEQALRIGLVSLPAMGIRTLFDFYLQKKLPGYQNFSSGLKELRKQGDISTLDVDLISPVIDLGHAASHRGHAPSIEDLEVCIRVYARLILGERELKGMVGGLAKRTPQRKNNKKVENE